MSAPRGVLIRSLQSIQIGAPRAMREREERNRELRLQEVDLQLHHEIFGTATLLPAFAEIDIDFEWEFHDAPSQRDSDLFLPHFTFGSFLHKGQAMVTASVKAYAENPDNGGIVGATVEVGALGGSDTPTEFAGIVNLTFQGYAIQRDDLTDDADLIEGADQEAATD